MQQPEQSSSDKGKFFDFIKKIEEIDKKVESENKGKEGDFDITNIDFTFDKISNISNLEKLGSTGKSHD